MDYPTYDPQGLHMGCAHYRRGCQLLAPCCGRFYTCRLCHDEQNAWQYESSTSNSNNSTEDLTSSSGVKIIQSNSINDTKEDEDEKQRSCHMTLDRHQVSTVRCMICGLIQKIDSPYCQNKACASSFGVYFCRICCLYDATPGKKIYHCHACGICRIGEGLGVDYFHCTTCKACLPLSFKASHVCVERVLDSDCPICLEFMFDSREAVYVSPVCGHAMHLSCFRMYAQAHLKCPTCGKPFRLNGVTPSMAVLADAGNLNQEHPAERERLQLAHLAAVLRTLWIEMRMHPRIILACFIVANVLYLKLYYAINQHFDNK